MRGKDWIEYLREQIEQYEKFYPAKIVASVVSDFSKISGDDFLYSQIEKGKAGGGREASFFCQGVSCRYVTLDMVPIPRPILCFGCIGGV